MCCKPREGNVQWRNAVYGLGHMNLGIDLHGLVVYMGVGGLDKNGFGGAVR